MDEDAQDGPKADDASEEGTAPSDALDEEIEGVKRSLEDLDRNRPLAAAQIHDALAPTWARFHESLDAQTRDLYDSPALTAALEQVRNMPTFNPDLGELPGIKALKESILASMGTLANHDWSASFTPSLEALIVATAGFKPRFQTLSRADAYQSESGPASPYSHEMTKPGAYFAQDEQLIDSFTDLNKAIATLISKAEGLQLVWRGQRDADWGVTSSLFRQLKDANGVNDPGPGVVGPQPYPTEDQMVAAERQILKVARQDWRFDGMSALETFARIQHAGGSSRFIDVTKNPFIGAWFACESGDDGTDARLFAFATTAPSKNGEAPRAESQIELDHEFGGYLPPWHSWDDMVERQKVDWGSGSRRRIWVPPAYDARIAAQNAAFLIDGVPLPAGKAASYFKAPNGSYWTRSDMLAAGSIYMKTAKPTRKPLSNKYGFAPTFTFRITASAKDEIKRVLTDRFGYSVSYIYPDMPMLASYVKSMELPALNPS
ncbi:FRG domain-containing protein [Micrococcus luteus]|uniref:FRG domain-containing protein n=2 Tax=Actinomycetes TaxID=1760 RepID=UPI0011A445F5|nr:FRG domain-containing protein [Micrococcus luteus]